MALSEFSDIFSEKRCFEPEQNHTSDSNTGSLKISNVQVVNTQVRNSEEKLKLSVV